MTDPQLKFLVCTTEYVAAAEAMIEALQGKLGVKTREEAGVEIERRTNAYVNARRALGEQARAMEALLP